MEIFNGDFTVTKDMVKYGKFIEGKIPKKVKGYFDCSCLELTTLEGSPEKVDGYFSCGYNKITSLKFCPKEIKGYFLCSNNRLTNLEFCPEIINGNFYCSNNILTNLEFCPKIVNGSFWFNYNRLTSLDFGPKIVNGNFNCINNGNNLEIEKEFILSGNYRNDYYTELLDYMLSNDMDLEEVKTWPKGFIANNLKISNKGSNIFNL